MAKNILIFFAGAVVTALVLGAAGFVYAQTQTPPNANPPAGFAPWGMMGGRGAGMMGAWRNNADADFEGPMHDAMIAALAEALNVTPEELEEAHDAGKTMWQFAEEQGLSADEFAQIMIQARTKALNQAVEDGAITQEQANWMIQRMSQAQANGFGMGACGGFRQSQGFRGGPGGRWNPPATQTP
ncbi:MAG: hypothetical protein PHD58_09435 [Anaerolineales bacterium]|nr:hypothetical protein [Anaerolineales bacterium]